MSSYNPNYRVDKCPASFITRITNHEQVGAALSSYSHLKVARSLQAWWVSIIIILMVFLTLKFKFKYVSLPLVKPLSWLHQFWHFNVPSILWQFVFPYIPFFCSHIIENLELIEQHSGHRPGHYKENVHPIIYGLFSRSPFLLTYSRECREALAKYLRSLIAPCFPLPERWVVSNRISSLAPPDHLGHR